MVATAVASSNGNHQHNGHVKTTTKKPAGAKKKPKPPLIIEAGDEEPKKLQPANLEQNDWEELRDYCDDANGKVNFHINRYPDWPSEARLNFLTMVRDLGKRSRVFVNKVECHDVFEAVLASMAGIERLDAYKKCYDAACEAAGFLHGDMAEVVAAKINNRLRQLHAPPVHSQRLAKIIRDAAGEQAAVDAVGPEGAAEQFLQHLAGDTEGQVLRYFQDEFYIWQGNNWTRQEDGRFQARVMRFLQSLGLPKLTERFCKDVVAHLKGSTLLDCWEASMPFTIQEEEPLQITKANRLVLSGQMLNLDEIASGQSVTEYGIDKSYFNEVVLPYAYDPVAKCPLWIQTLKHILPDTEEGDNRRMVLQEFFGYSLLRDCRFQKFLVLIGDGGNGKSTVTATWKKMLGGKNWAALGLENIGDDFRLASLRGKLANFSGELNYLNKINEGILKQLISGEALDVNRKNKESVTLQLQAKLIVNTNQLPQINDPTSAMWDRMIAMPFEVRVRDAADEDHERPVKLEAELPGILRWAIAGLKRLVAHGGFTPCSKCAAVTKRHRLNSNSVLSFISECCQRNSQMMTASPPLYEIYRRFTLDSGRKPVAAPEFGERMNGAGFRKKRGRWINGRREPVHEGLVLSQVGSEYAKHLDHQYERKKYSYPIHGPESH